MSNGSNGVTDLASMGKTGSRRKFINQTFGSIALPGVNGPGLIAAGSNQEIIGKASAGKLKIIVAGGHPGDPESKGGFCDSD